MYRDTPQTKVYINYHQEILRNKKLASFHLPLSPPPPTFYPLPSTFQIKKSIRGQEWDPNKIEENQMDP